MQPLFNPSGVRAVIFDISGTVMDFGSRGPVAAFVALFGRHGVAITAAEARVPMGLHKLDHVWALLSNPEIAERWRQANGSPPDRQTLEAMYAGFAPLQMEVLKSHFDLLPGVAEVAAELRARGIRIASTTGFETGMMGDLKAAAAAQGYEPECWVCPDQTGGGRPAPWMIYHAARQLGVFPLRTFVKVGDTPADIAEALNAGTWAVSVVTTGNEIGLSQEQWEALTETVRTERFDAAREKFLKLGAHYAISSVADLLPVVDRISERIDRGERP
jgi:phosphonoacetaldehyde hydrolase